MRAEVGWHPPEAGPVQGMGLRTHSQQQVDGVGSGDEARCDAMSLPVVALCSSVQTDLPTCH